MKLSRMSQLILGLGILVITLGSLGVARSQQLNEVKQLSDNLSIAELRLSKLDLKDLYSQQDTLNAQLGRASAEMQSAKAALSQANDSITISAAMYRIAWNSGVEVAQITSAAQTTEKWKGLNCSVLPISVLVKGDVPNLIDFIMRLNSDFPIGVVKSADIVVPRAKSESPVNTPPVTDNTTGVISDNITITISDNATGSDNMTAAIDDLAATLTDILDAAGPARDTRPAAQIQLAIYTYKGS